MGIITSFLYVDSEILIATLHINQKVLIT
jgi:hypothetical protein